jgi:tetratricopeptide (TPR) repeat protein
MKRFHWMTATLGVAFAASSTALAADGPQCIGDDAQKALTVCPEGVKQFTPKSDKPSGIKVGTIAGQDGPKKDNKPKPPDESMSAGQRDVRRAQAKDKTMKLLVSEIAQLEQLWKVTSKSASDRPQLARRLAETYVELENAAFRDKTEAEIKKDADAAGKAKKTLDGSRLNSIKYYKTIIADYPDYSTLDEVLYYLAYEYEQAQNLDEARKVYFQLINDRPQSKYIPNAYLAFGELFFTEAQGDPSKYELARQSYAKVLEYPPATNKVWGYAEYKLGYVYWNLGEKENLAKALEAFKKTIEYAKQYAAQPGVKALGNSARKDIVPVYALIGKPDGSFAFFKPLTEDQSDRQTFDMQDQLGLNYLDTGHYPEAIALYTDLLNRDKGDNSCKYQAHIVEATQASKGGSAKANIREKMDDMVKRYQSFKTESHSEESKTGCANATAELLYETAASWQIEAQGSGGVRGTGDKNTMKLAAQLYGLVSKNFTKEDFSKFEFPRIVKDDWPTLFKVKYAQADLLYFQGDWENCGPAFDAVVDEDPNAPEAAEAAYAAVLCYQKRYDATHTGDTARKGTGNLPGQKGKDKKADQKADQKAALAKKELSGEQKGMVGAFSRYLCVIKPGDGDQKAKEQYVDVKFARARVWFEAHYWEESGAAFKDIALNHSDLDVGVYASALYLESLNILGTQMDPPRASCFDEMGEAVPKFITLYCDGGKAAKNADTCAMLTSVQIDILRLKAEALLKQAQGATSNAARLYEAAAVAYLDLWKKYGEAPMEAGKKPEYAKMDEVLWNAAEAYQSARLVMKSIQVRLILLNPKFGYDKGELARRSIYKIGGNYQAIAVYDEAAKWYERYAKEFTKSEKADSALSDAVVLRLGLGQEQDAIKDADDFMKLYGQSKPAETARVAFAIGAHYVEREDWDNARKRLSASMKLIDASAPLDVQVQAHALLGRVMVRIKSDSAAQTEYKKVQSLWKDPAAAAEKIKTAAEGDERRVGKALTAVGEAFFYFAEKEKKKVDGIKFPEYKGPNTKEEVIKHIKTKVADWMKKKGPAIDAAEKEYIKIVELKPAPPPRWVIAAGSRVGSMWGEFVREFRAAPIPADMKRDDELRNTYYNALDEASEPQKVRAKKAFETCLSYSVTYQFFDEYSRTCEVWLSKTYKNEYHQIDEFRGAPTRVNGGLSDRPYPVDVTGKPVNPNPVTEADKGSGGEKKDETVTSSDSAAPVDDKKKGGKKAPPAKAPPGKKK